MGKTPGYRSTPSRVAKDPMDYFFFLVSFLAVIILAIAPLFLNALSELDSFTKVIVPLVIFGALFGYLGTEIELSRTRSLHLSTVVFLVAFLVEIYFVWFYVYL